MSDIGKVLEYLESTNGNFIDKMMVNIVQQRDDYIYAEMGKVCMEFGVYIDKDKLKKWIQMCAELEQLSAETQGDLAIKTEIMGLKSKISKLEWENLQLKHKISELENEHEDYWDTVEDWEDN